MSYLEVCSILVKIYLNSVLLMWHDIPCNNKFIRCLSYLYIICVNGWLSFETEFQLSFDLLGVLYNGFKFTQKLFIFRKSITRFFGSKWYFLFPQVFPGRVLPEGKENWPNETCDCLKINYFYMRKVFFQSYFSSYIHESTTNILYWGWMESWTLQVEFWILRRLTKR